MERPRKFVFANSADYARNTGGWIYNTHFINGLEALGWEIERLALPAGFPRPDVAACKQSGRLLAGLEDGVLLVSDQICLSPLSDIVAREAERLRLVMIFHHPIAMETGLSAAERARFAAHERRALRACGLVVTTSRTTAAALMTDYGVPSERIAVAPPGSERFNVVATESTSAPRLLSVGAVTARKGYHVLIEALAGLRDAAWQLDIVGDLDRAPDYVAQLRRAIDAGGLTGRISLTGGLVASDIDARWCAAHIFVAASLHEGYGMAVAEAIARGLPTVTTRVGAVGDWLDPEAAVIVRDGSAAALRDALGRVIAEPALRARLRDAARVEARRFPTWADAARVVNERLRQL